MGRPSLRQGRPHQIMAYKSGARSYPVEVDIEDLHFRCTAAMAIAGLTVQDVADYMGIRIDYVRNAIQGRTAYMSVNFLVSFTAVCQCKITDILPFADHVLPLPFTYTVPGGGAVREIEPSPYRVSYSDPEDLADRRWFGTDPAE